MPPTIVNAAESTANINTSTSERDVSSRLAELDPSAAPFTLLLQKIDSRVAENPKVEWFEKEKAPLYDQVNGAHGAGATSLVVDNAAYFRIGQLAEVPRTGEVIRVTAKNTVTNTLTIQRSVGDTAAAAMVDNDDLFLIGTAFPEGSALPPEQSHQEVGKYNYAQIFREAFGATGTRQATRSYLGNPRTRARREHGRDFKIAMEHAFLFGERSEDTSDTNAPIRSMSGVLAYATSNVTNIGGPMSDSDLWAWAEDVFESTAGSDERWLLASPLAITVIDRLAQARIMHTPKDRVFGVKINRIATSHGEFMLVKDRLLRNGAGGNGYGGYAIALDPQQLAYRYMQGRNSKLHVDQQATGDDKWVDEYFAECTLEFRLPDVHGVATGITG